MQGSGLLLQLMYGSRTAEALSATDAMNQIRLAEIFASTIAEHAGIVAASAIYSFGRVSGLSASMQAHGLVHMNFCQGVSTSEASYSRHVRLCTQLWGSLQITIQSG